jgi:hypothetical protein
MSGNTDDDGFRESWSTRELLQAAQESMRSKDAVIASLRMALSDTAEALNVTRLIMKDKEARDHAGNLVDVARRIVRATA